MFVLADQPTVHSGGVSRGRFSDQMGFPVLIIFYAVIMFTMCWDFKIAFCKLRVRYFIFKLELLSFLVRLSWQTFFSSVHAQLINSTMLYIEPNLNWNSSSPLWMGYLKKKIFFKYIYYTFDLSMNNVLALNHIYYWEGMVDTNILAPSYNIPSVSGPWKEHCLMQ